MAVSTSVLHMPQGNGQLPADWQWGRLEDLSAGVFDCPHSTPILAEQGPFVVRSQDVRSGIFRSDQAARVSEQTYQERIARAEPRFGDLLFSREGTYFGIAAEVPKNKRVCLGQRMVLIRPNPSILDSRYLRYWLNSSVMVVHMHGHRDGSVAERLNMPTIRGLPVAYPPLREQRAIAHILGTLDDKIELNRRMNETLEAIARALFKSWFVDFDPVRAKSQHRDPGLPPAVAELFPSTFECADLGEVPQGWSVASLGDHVVSVKGKSYSSDELRESKTALVTLKSFARGGGYRPDGLKPYGGAYKPSQVVGRGELIIACTDVTQAAEVIGKPALVRSDGKFDTLVASLDLVIIRPLSDAVSIPFLYCLFRSDQFSEHAYAHTTGTTVLHLAKEAIPSFRFVFPPRNLVAAFANIAGPVFERIDDAESESRTLSALRDALLPKLISGALRVADAERLVEAAA